jgi:NADH-quinone oxidoreductase subunit J
MNTLIMVIFLGLSAFTLAAGIMVVTVKNIIHSALWLIASFFTVAAMYLLMEAEFIAIVQVLIYVGAISILILFAIMLTRHVTGEGVRQLYKRWWIALLVAAALFGLLIAPTVANYSWNSVPPTAPDQVATISSSVQIGTAFMREYLLPFEIASVLLLVALIGAIVIAYEERSARRRVLTLAEEMALRQPPRGEPLHSAPVATVTANSPEAPIQP